MTLSNPTVTNLIIKDPPGPAACVSLPSNSIVKELTDKNFLARTVKSGF
jgi:hypothetical protein